jgi:hypothetical protein
VLELVEVHPVLQDRRVGRYRTAASKRGRLRVGVGAVDVRGTSGSLAHRPIGRRRPAVTGPKRFKAVRPQRATATDAHAPAYRSRTRIAELDSFPSTSKSRRTVMSDRDTVVVNDGGSGMGVILGVIAVILVLAGLWYFLMGPGAGSGSTTTPTDVDVNVSLPSIAPEAS